MSRETLLAARTSARKDPSQQQFLNGEIHDWYRIILGYSDHLVAKLLRQLNVGEGQAVLDPFAGTGTTLIECMKRGVDAVGLEVNPSSVFAARVKTNWHIDVGIVLALLDEIACKRTHYLRADRTYRTDPTFAYLESSGMLERRWISQEPLRQALALKACIYEMDITPSYRRFLLLALMNQVVRGASNVKFGPELYCQPPKRKVDVFRGFARRVEQMALDLSVVKQPTKSSVRVLEGDARDAAVVLDRASAGRFSAVISSPPYPAEHDYTRNSRLELAFLEYVTDRDALRRYKKRMIRSHTKGIYKDDTDADHVAGNDKVERIARKIERKVRNNTDGFARFYSSVVRSYFGGMKRHFQSLKSVLVPSAQLAYVVGDQSCYAQVHIPTAEILGSIAEECGYEVVAIEHWRSRWSTVTSKHIGENILILRHLNTKR